MPRQPYLSINFNTGSAQGGPTAAELTKRIRAQIVDNKRTAPILAKSNHASVLGMPSVIEAALFEYPGRGYYDVHMKLLNFELDLLQQTMPEGVK